MNKLHVDSVIKSFGSKQILTDIFISLKKGEIIGLVGRNGTGKSTLLKIIFGSLSAESKFIKVENRLSKGLFGNRKLIKYLPQTNFLPSHIKVKTIIELLCDPRNASFLKGHDLIKPMAGNTSKRLSGGERRLLEVLLIVFSDSPYVLLDEPFNGIAPIYKEIIKEMIQNQSENKGFILTDHDYRSVLEIATRLFMLHDGGLREIRNKDELMVWEYTR